MVVYEKNTVPFNVAQFLAVFLDGALPYMVHHSKEVKGQPHTTHFSFLNIVDFWPIFQILFCLQIVLWRDW